MNVVWCSAPRDPSVEAMRRITSAGSGLLLAALLLTGCSAASSGGGDSFEEPGVAAPGYAGEDLDGGAYDEQGDRDVIVTGSMTVTAESPLDAARDAVRIVQTAGGRVDARTEYAPSHGDRGSATLLLRIPADKLQDVLDDLAALGVDGKADEVTTSSDDVTAYVTDLESRIQTQRGIIERLNALFTQAKSIEDLIQLETQIAQHQAELESLLAQQRSIADQVSMSTIQLYLRSEAEAPVEQPMDFLTGLQSGWTAFVAFFSGLLVALGVLLPWIVTAGLVTAVVVLLVKRRRAKATAE